MSKNTADRAGSGVGIEGRSSRVLEIVHLLAKELGRGPTGSEIAARVSDGQGDVRAELGALLHLGLVACQGLAETGPAPCWVPVSR